MTTMNEFEYELMNMSQEEMERIANGNQDEEDSTVRPGGEQNNS
jgi:hypothetical protein